MQVLYAFEQLIINTEELDASDSRAQDDEDDGDEDDEMQTRFIEQ